jgi:nitroreductase
MTEILDIMKDRRSIRKYEERDVSQQDLDKILEAVQWAPSWANTQVWEVIVVKDPAQKEKLQATILPKNPATKAIVNAPVVLALCGKLNSSGYYNNVVTTKFGDWMLFDLGIATQDICLCAQSLGLGTVIVGLFDHNKANEVLGVPDGYDVVTLIPLGYPAKAPSAPKRREISEFTHFDKF